jgi:hypothetical protein
MPPKLSARRIFWAGLAITVLGVVVQQALYGVLFSIWGDDAVQSFSWSLMLNTQYTLLVPLGVAVLACSLIAGNIESAGDSQSETGRWRPMPPRLTARQIALTGVILVVVGLVLMNSLDELFMSLNGKVDFTSNLVRDLLTIVTVPLGTVALPLGVALLPSSLVVRMLESRGHDREQKSAVRKLD